MAVAVYISAQITCDNCCREMDDGIVMQRRNARDLRRVVDREKRRALAAGWSVPSKAFPDEDVLCPDCRRPDAAQEGR